MEERKRIGQRIKEIRKEQGLTQRQLAEKVGIAFQNLSSIESGKYNTGIDLLNRIASALGKIIEFNSDGYTSVGE